MKKLWNNPLLFTYKLESGGEGSWTGEGSGQSSPDVIPYDYEMWCVVFEDFPAYNNLDGNSTPLEWSDYVAWMTANGFEGFIEEA